jgi:hypothetical protein
LAITFPNPNIAFSKHHIKFSGEVGKRRDPVICSIDRVALAAYAGISGQPDDATLLVAFETHRQMINAIAASQWNAGIDRPAITYQDLASFPADKVI